MAALDVHVELWIDDEWVDITSDVYTRAPITITRGRTAEGGQVEPSSCTLTVNNRDGTYSPRNPSSDYFGKIGRNTPIRVRVTADVRFLGEVSSWPTKWEPKGADVYMPLEAAGLMRRLGQGNAPAPSAPRRYLPTTAPAAYWPLEDGPQTVRAQLAAGAGSTMRLAGRDTAAPQVWGQGKLADWLAPTAKIEGSVLLGVSLRADVQMTGFTDTWTMEMVRSGGGSNDPTVGSSQMACQFKQDPADTDNVHAIIRFNQLDEQVHIDIDFDDLDDAPIDPSFWDDNPHHVRVTATQDGSDIDYQVWIDGALVLSATDTGVTLGPVDEVSNLASITVTEALVMGHWAVWTDPPDLADSVDAALGHAGETAGRRIERLCSEQGIPFVAVGDLDDTAAMGPQAPLPPLELLLEAAAADHGILYESRTALGLEYRTRADLYDQAPALTADYSTKVFHGLPEPVDDDRFTRNDVTAKRPHSGEARAVLEAGPLSTADPPDGVGTYDTTVTLNLAGDGDLTHHAAWLLALGTVDEARYPRLAFRLNAVPGIAADIAGLELGDLVRITDLPSWLPPDDVDALVQGAVETLESHMRDIELTTAPASPYDVGVFGDTVGDGPDRFDTAGTIRGLGFATITTTQTTITFETLTGPPWTQDDAEFPFDIYVGGERMTVTDIAGTGGGPLEQSFTVVRSVNGVVKTHAPGTAVRLWKPARFAL
jgi:hypothetical protein